MATEIIQKNFVHTSIVYIDRKAELRVDTAERAHSYTFYQVITVKEETRESLGKLQIGNVLGRNGIHQVPSDVPNST